MASIRKSDLVSAIAAETGLTVVDTKVVVDELINAISQTFIEGQSIELRGFGTFNLTERRPRLARNMATGERIKVSGKTDVKMKPCKSLKELVNNSLTKQAD